MRVRNPYDAGNGGGQGYGEQQGGYGGYGGQENDGYGEQPQSAPESQTTSIDNFVKCGAKGMTLKIERTKEGDNVKKPVNLSLDQVVKHISAGNPSFKDMRYAPVYCIDGRGEHGSIHVPGGDASEFLLALAAFSADVARGRPIAPLKVKQAMKLYVARHAIPDSRPFYMHTDGHAEHFLQEYFHNHHFHLADPPPPNMRNTVLNAVVRNPDSIGCGHLKRTLMNPADYKVPKPLTEAVLKAFLSLLWEDQDQGVGALRLETLNGDHAEGDLVTVKGATCGNGKKIFSFKPFVQGQNQVFVYQPEAVRFHRFELARFMCNHKGLLGVNPYAKCSPTRLEKTMENIFNAGLDSTATALAADRPNDTVSMQVSPNNGANNFNGGGHGAGGHGAHNLDVVAYSAQEFDELQPGASHDDAVFADEGYDDGGFALADAPLAFERDAHFSALA